jgi:hypothetical protein
MRNDRKIDVSFSASAEDVIRRFMKVAEETMPNANLVPVIDWHISAKFTDKVTGKVTNFGPGIDVGAIELEKLTDELIVPMGGLKVAIRLAGRTASRRSADIRFFGRFFCRRRQLIGALRSEVPRCPTIEKSTFPFRRAPRIISADS